MSKNEETAREIAQAFSGIPGMDYDAAAKIVLTIIDRAYPDPAPRLEQAREAVSKLRIRNHVFNHDCYFVDEVYAALAPREKP